MGDYKKEAEAYAKEGRDMVRAFAEKFKPRLDWHEPDEEGITAEVRGDHLDNAFGDSAVDNCFEYVVVLKVKDVVELEINLAHLLAAASTGTGRK